MMSVPIDRRRNSDTAIRCLDRAVHPGTSDIEALESLRAFRRLTEGATISYLIEENYGDGGYLDVLEEEWEQKFAEQDAIIAQLSAQVADRENIAADRDRLQQKLDRVLKRISGGPSVATGPRKRRDRSDDELNAYNLTDNEWAVVEPLLPERYRSPFIRKRIGAMLWVLRGNTWRALTPGTNRWMTFYNQHRGWEKSGLWEMIWGALESCGVVTDEGVAEPPAVLETEL